MYKWTFSILARSSCTRIDCSITDNNKDKGWQEVSMRASAQQQESCVSILSVLPSPLEATPRLETIRWLCGPSTPAVFFFFFLRIAELRGHGGEWETGYCISFTDRLFSLVRQLDLPHFLDHPASMLIDCQLTVLVTSDLAVSMWRWLFKNSGFEILGICSIRMHLNIAWLYPDSYFSGFRVQKDFWIVQNKSVQVAQAGSFTLFLDYHGRHGRT